MIKTLWIYWNTGIKAAPPIVHKCVDSWKHHNPTWKIVLLDNTNLRDYYKGTQDGRSIQAWSDVVRINLLKEYGGVWVDATVACNKPLDSWLPAHTKTGFFAFRKPKPDTEVASWFLYADKDNCIVDRWKLLVDEYWKNRPNMDYLWFHGLFNNVLEDPACQTMWNKTKPWLANHKPLPETPDNPHWFTPYNASRWTKIRKQGLPLTGPCYKLAHGTSRRMIQEPTIMRIFNYESK